MGQTMPHYLGEDAGLLHLGERVAGWLREQRLTAKEVAMRAKLDERTARSLLEGSCGVRAFDALARAYSWPFIESVMEPAVGADPLTAREMELEARQAETAALHARVERERALRLAPGASVRGAVRLAARAGVVSDSPLGREG